ncbi:MAG: hypothetical protein SPK60_05085, partial [Sodaliphilus sp.]|nr:hypothetical protein [Bacteroidales bacterium]MDY5706285.1 hypothetical protein [Sodaliphilus sp.]
AQDHQKTITAQNPHINILCDFIYFAIEIADSNPQFLFIFADSIPQNPKKTPKNPKNCRPKATIFLKTADSTPQIL